MRTLIVLVTAVAAMSAVAAAQGSRHPTTSLSVSSLKVVYPNGIVLSGTASNRQPGMGISILARPFTSGSMARIASVTTRTGGRWSYVVHPVVATTYAASFAGKPSRTIMVGVRPALILHLQPNGSLHAHVAAAHSFRGKEIQLQRFTSAGWKTLAKHPLDRTSSTVFATTTLPHGSPLLRLAMSVNATGPGYLGGFGSALRYPSHGLTLQLSTAKTTYGDTFRLSGTVYPKRAGTTLGIYARPFNGPAFQRVATIQTTTGGKWQLHARAPFTTSYQTQVGNASSRILTVGVRPDMSVQTLGGDRIWAHVGLAKSIVGKIVQIQRKTGGRWRTIARLPLDRRASAIFTPAQLPAGTSTLRTAISVNQVGAGYLGGFGKPFVYHR
jgi:hypothetical protein